MLRVALWTAVVATLYGSIASALVGMPPHSWARQDLGIVAQLSSGDRLTSRVDCGARALAAALVLHGIYVDVDALEESLFLTERGASLADVEQAARRYGFQTLSVTVSPHQLSRFPEDMLAILHVKMPSTSDEPNHFVLYTGKRKDGRMQIIDAPYDEHLLLPRELAAIWNGTALVISRTPFEQGTLLPPSRPVVLYGLAAIFVSGLITAARSVGFPRRLCLRTSLSNRVSVGVAAKQGAILFGIAALCGVVLNVSSEEGLLSLSKTVGQFPGGDQPFAEVSLDEAKGLWVGGAHFIDARDPHAFHAGHIDWAVNLPASSGWRQQREVLDRLMPDAPVVVYCQSAGCPYSDTVAKVLVSRGFEQVFVFRGGWEEWSRPLAAAQYAQP